MFNLKVFNQCIQGTYDTIILILLKYFNYIYGTKIFYVPHSYNVVIQNERKTKYLILYSEQMILFICHKREKFSKEIYLFFFALRYY